jgi:hypothetical protein
MTHQQKVKSFRQLRRLRFKLKRNDSVQISRAGSHWKARFRGRPSFVFGTSPQAALQRLLSTFAKERGITDEPITELDKLLLRSLSGEANDSQTNQVGYKA